MSGGGGLQGRVRAGLHVGVHAGGNLRAVAVRCAVPQVLDSEEIVPGGQVLAGEGMVLEIGGLEGTGFPGAVLQLGAPDGGGIVFLVEGEIAEALVGPRSLPPDEAGMVLVPLEIDGIPQGDGAGGKGRRG